MRNFFCRKLASRPIEVPNTQPCASSQGSSLGMAFRAVRNNLQIPTQPSMPTATEKSRARVALQVYLDNKKEHKIQMDEEILVASLYPCSKAQTEQEKIRVETALGLFHRPERKVEPLTDSQKMRFNALSASLENSVLIEPKPTQTRLVRPFNNQQDPFTTTKQSPFKAKLMTKK